MSEQQSAPGEQSEQERTLYTASELVFILGLEDSPSARITREQMALRTPPAASTAAVEAAVTSGLLARGKIHPGTGDQWQLGAEAQVIAAALTGADRWLGVALAEGEAMRLAYLLRHDARVLMFTQDELDTFLVSVIESEAAVPEAVANISRSFLGQGPGRTVSLRRTDLDAGGAAVQMMFHVEEDGPWRIAHEPVTNEGVLTVSDLAPEQIEPALERLWADGVSQAPGVR